MEEPSEKVDPVVDPETPQPIDEEDSSDDSVPTTKSTSKGHGKANPEPQRRRRSLRRWAESRPVEHILRDVQSTFPKRKVRTLLSVLKNPRARTRRLVRIEQRQKKARRK